PAVAAAAPAATAATHAAGEVEFEARLGVGEERGPDANAALGSPQRLCKVEDGALQVTDRDPFVDRKRFDLHELREMRGAGGVAPVAAAGNDDVDRRAPQTLRSAERPGG